MYYDMCMHNIYHYYQSVLNNTPRKMLQTIPIHEKYSDGSMHLKTILKKRRNWNRTVIVQWVESWRLLRRPPGFNTSLAQTCFQIIITMFLPQTPWFLPFQSGDIVRNNSTLVLKWLFACEFVPRFSMVVSLVNMGSLYPHVSPRGVGVANTRKGSLTRVVMSTKWLRACYQTIETIFSAFYQHILTLWQT